MVEKDLLTQNQKKYFSRYSAIYEYEVTQNVFACHRETHKESNYWKILLFVKHTINWKNCKFTSLITFFSELTEYGAEG